jgi:hypothetical protein
MDFQIQRRYGCDRPKEGTITDAATQFSHTLPPYSIQVMELEAH